ncbi:MAG: hypothetical protein JEY71_11840 [Sphaerochaeta sp.]|nr:hypothetical protein [Sphaerochaeta sp.]
MTTTQAVTEVLKEWGPGTALYGHEIHKMVVRKLRANGETKRPLDATVLRRLRERANIYGVRVLKPSDSLYYRELRQAVIAEDPDTGQNLEGISHTA